MKRALVIDDEFAELQMLASALEEAGFDVEKASDGTHALALLQGGVFDLVLCDAGVPGARVSRLIEVARAHPSMDTATFVVLAHRFERLEAHDVTVLEKPIRWQSLQVLIASVLGVSGDA